MSDTCYWVVEGKCALSHMQEGLVFEILASSQIARRALLSCAHQGAGGGCANIFQEYLDFANHPGTLVIDDHELNAIHQAQVTQYSDRNGQAQRKQPQFPVLPPGPVEDK